MSPPSDIGGSLSGIAATYGGEPAYPAPWTTTEPREGLRDDGQGRIVCLSPSVNLTPIGGSMMPVPYMIYDTCDHVENYSQRTFYTGKRVLRFCSRTSHVHGDEAGTGGGVVSGTVGKECEPIDHAPKVRVEGSEVVRHLDRFYMEHRNTIGEALFVRDVSIGATPADTDPLPGSIILAQAAAQPLPQAPPPAVRPPGQVIPGPWQPRPPPMPPPEPGGLPWYVRWGRWGAMGLVLLIPGDTPLIRWPGPDADETERALESKANSLLQPLDPKYNEEVRKWYDEELAKYQAQKRQKKLQKEPTPVPAPLPQPSTARISKEDDDENQPCILMPYKNLKCPDGQAHHVVADRAFRSTGRPSSMYDTTGYVPGMTEGDGLAICLTGQAGDRTSEHGIATNDYNTKLNLVQNNGMVRLGDAEIVGASAVEKATNGRCKAKDLVVQLRTYHKAKGMSSDMWVRQQNATIPAGHSPTLGSDFPPR